MRSLASILASLALVAAACGDSAAPGGLTGADGVAIEDPDTSRIVSLSGAITEILFELGLGGSVVAIEVTTVHPPQAAQLPIVGVGRFLTAEAVLEQRPTLVIGDTQTSPQEAIQQIRSAGVPVLITDEPVSFEQLYDKVLLMGSVLGAVDEAEGLVERLRDDLDAASALATGDPPRIAFVYSRGPDVILLFGAEMTTRPLIEAAGGIDAGADSGVVGTVDFTPEALVAAQPDVIVMNSEGLGLLGGVDGVLEVPGFAATPAGQTGSIIGYPEGDILTFGPRVAEVLSRLVADLDELGTG